MNIQIKKFDPTSIDPCRICVFVGRRGTGKSQLVTDILYHQRKIPMGVVMSGTEESNEHYQSYVPDSFIYGKYEPEIIDKIIKHQGKVIGKLKGPAKDDFKNPSNSVFMLLDDCMYDNKWTRHEIMRCVFMNGRHYRILFLLTLQYCMDLPPSLRGQIDYLFILRENIIQNRKKLYDHFFGIFPTFDSFNEVLNQCTENYECLVLIHHRQIQVVRPGNPARAPHVQLRRARRLADAHLPQVVQPRRAANPQRHPWQNVRIRPAAPVIGQFNHRVGKSRLVHPRAVNRRRVVHPQICLAVLPGPAQQRQFFRRHRSHRHVLTTILRSSIVRSNTRADRCSGSCSGHTSVAA